MSRHTTRWMILLIFPYDKKMYIKFSFCICVCIGTPGMQHCARQVCPRDLFIECSTWWPANPTSIHSAGVRCAWADKSVSIRKKKYKYCLALWSKHITRYRRPVGNGTRQLQERSVNVVLFYCCQYAIVCEPYGLCFDSTLGCHRKQRKCIIHVYMHMMFQGRMLRGNSIILQAIPSENHQPSLWAMERITKKPMPRWLRSLCGW